MAAVETKPIISQLKLPKEGEPYLEGWRCESCSTVYVDARQNCGHCLARGSMTAIPLSNTGKIYNWTIVYRNFPSVEVPFASVIVDLDGGGTIKGNLVGIDPKPENIRFDMPVKTVFRPVAQTDEKNNLYIGYFFAPAE